MRLKIVPDVVVPCDVLFLPPQACVREAARLMASHNVAALLVTEGDALLGIVTERDVSARVVAAGLDPDSTPLSAVMSPRPRSLAPDDSISEALELMRRHSFRHLPVLDEQGRPVAMVSVRDLYAVVQTQLERDILNRDAWILGVADAWGDGVEDGG
ncbi:MAG TPA: CBS domain-containing protein [Magnetospirillum sp.]|jgi:CBS domain-containing protein|nr:CBS domain-containing protein [Magnetospirillum sp.]